MIYNTGVKFGHTIQVVPTQEEIFNCPEFYALTYDEIKSHPQCPIFLKQIIGWLPFDGRQNVVQVRPQDFRTQLPGYMGDHWHTDIMCMLEDGTPRIAKSSTEFHLMTASFGDVVETEFILKEIEFPDLLDRGSAFNPGALTDYANSRAWDTVHAKPNQLVEYTSLDIHRMGRNPRLGKLRLLVVAFDCDTVTGGGKVLPSLREREGK